MKKDHYHYWVSFAHSFGDGKFGFTGEHCMGKSKMNLNDIKNISNQIKNNFNFESIVLISFSELECDCDESN